VRQAVDISYSKA